MSAIELTAPPALPRRAEIAHLTLQVRAAERQADELEAQLDRQADTAADVLRQRLDALLAARQVAMADELAQARRDADELIAAARLAATAERARVGAPATTDVDPPTVELDHARPGDAARVLAPAASAPPTAPARPLVPPAVPPAFPPGAPAPTAPAASAPPTAPARPLVPPAFPPGAPAPTPPAVAGQMTLVVDPDSFARAVAAAVAAVLAERPATPAQPIAAPWLHAVPVGTAKKSFWSGLWHADVLLAVMAMAIILVILLAWSV